MLGLLLLGAACSKDAPEAPSGWQPEQLIGTGLVCYASGGRVPVARSPEPALAVNAGGQALMAWTRCDGSINDIWAARWTDSNWEMTRPIGTQQNDANPRVVIGPNGGGFATWATAAGNVGSAFDPSGGWSAPEAFNSAPLYNGGGTTQLVADAQGTPIAVWYETHGGSVRLSASRHRVSGWTLAETIEMPSVGDVTAASIGADRQGNVLFVWMHYESGRLSPWVNLLEASGGWSPAARLEGSSVSLSAASPPKVAVDAAGDATVVWGSDLGLRANRRTSAGWAGAETIAGATTGPVGDPALARDALGRTVVVWRWGYHELWASRFDAVWGAPQRVATGLSGPPQIVCDGAGNAMAVWAELNTDTIPIAIWAARFDVSRGWAQPQSIRSASGTRPTPTSLAVDGQGNILLLWVESASDRFEVWSRRFGAP
jgi:hypothetical protein